MRRPDRELPVWVPDFAVCVLPAGLERRESDPAALEWPVPEWAVPEWPALEWAAPERFAPDPLCEEGGGFEAAEGVRAELSLLPGDDAAGGLRGAVEGAGAAPAGLEGAATCMEGDRVSTESVAMGDRPA